MAVAKSLRAILEGSPVSADHRVVNAELRAKLEEIEVQAALNGALFFEDALADLPTGTEGDTAFVLDDGTAANNGIYLKGASAWAKTAALPAAFSDAVSALADLATLEASLGDLATKDTVATADIADDAVTDAKLAHVPSGTIKGRVNAGEGTASNLTALQVRNIINVADGATANDTDANLKNRANHTGAQAISTVTGLQSALEGKATSAQGAKADTAVQPGDLADVATSGDYADLTGKPTLGTAAAQAATAFASAAQGAKADSAVQPGDLSTVATTGDYDDLTGKPTLGTAAAEPATAFATSAQGVKADEAARRLTRQAIRAEYKEAFSNAITGEDRPAATLGSYASNSAHGRILRLDGADAVGGFQDIAPRQDVALEFGRSYRARFVLDRVTDPADPAGHSIEVRMQNLSSARAQVSNVVITNLGPVAVSDGLVEYAFTFSRSTGQDYQTPATARYAVPYLRLYGGDHETDIAVIEIVDVTDSAALEGSLAAVATTGDYDDLTGKPALADVATSGDSDDLTEGEAKLLLTVAERTKLAQIVETPIDGLVLRDPWGFIDAVFTGGDGVGGSFTTDEIAAKDQLALASSGLRAARLDVMPFAAGYNQMIEYGQSLSIGSEGWPVLTTETDAALRLFMAGSSVRPNSKTGTTFVPVGTSELTPLKATAQPDDYTDILTPSEQAALTPGDTVAGETASIAAAVTLRMDQMDRLGALTDASRAIIVTSCGVGSRTAAQLTPGASPELFNRVQEAMEVVGGYATADSEPHHVPAVIYMQGEEDQDLGVTTKAEYKADLAALFDGMQSAIKTETGQTRDAAILIYQTRQNNPAHLFNVTEAQLELALERSDVFMVGPHYQVTDKATHLDPNGYRWFGCLTGKVAVRVLLDRIDWKPLHCTGAVQRGREILLTFHVPAPPLQFQDYYDQLVAKQPGNKGFAAFVGSTEQTIASVEVVGACTVRITLADLPAGPVQVTYAQGIGDRDGGNLCDSDDYVAPFTYEYEAGTGQYAEANIAALIDKPYPMQNFCAAFQITPTPE